MITHEPKFEVGNHVKTNALYREIFSGKEQINGSVSEVEPCNILETDACGFTCLYKIRETVIMITVGDSRSLNQDYFERVV
jgi:hypothetical protein